MPELLKDVRRIVRMLRDPLASSSQFPDEPRKSSARILAEHLLWRARYGEICKYYFCWGLDRRAAPRWAELIPYGQFRKLRDGRNHVARNGARGSYEIVLEDKYLFALLLEGLGHPVPRLRGLIEPEAIEWLRPRRRAPLASLLETGECLDLFCKPILGEQGKGVFRLQVAAGEVRVNGVTVSLEELPARIRRRSILQERVEQHSALAALHPHSLNTIRLITASDGGTFRLLSYPILRIGVGGRPTDNWSDRGLQVLIDPDTGRLRGPGRPQKGPVSPRHPDTGIPFDGYEVPFFAEAAGLAARVHRDLDGLHSIGWDLAIAPQGPLLIEGNANWGGGVRMALDPEFKQEFLRLCARA